MGLFSKRTSSDAPNDLNSKLDTVLYEVPGTDTEITWADAVESTLIVGSTGSGKTSGPARHIAMAMLKQGFSFCVLCAKKDEKQRWIKYAQDAGRSDDLILFDRDNDLQFNFLDYEMKRDGEGAGDVFNASNMLVNLNEQIRILQSGSSQNDEKFWDNSLRRLISRTISLLKFTNQNIDIYNIRRVIADSLTSEDIELYDKIKSKITTQENIPEQDKKNAQENLFAMIEGNYFVKLLEICDKLNLTDDLSITLQYWKREFANLSEKTRSIIIESALGIIEPFLVDGILKNQFSKGLSPYLMPENIIKNKSVVIVDFSVKEFGFSGTIASSIYKISFQSAMERRDVSKEDDPKPVAFFVDEYQNFCYPSKDALFQATARSSWVATVYITQNLNGIIQVMGSNNALARTKSLLGNMNLKYFASNSDYDTNKWASDMIGEHWMNIDNFNIDGNAKIKGKTQRSERRRKVEIDDFTTLKTGRKINNFEVEAVVFKAGKLWGEDQDNYALATFKQK
ncbi:type IV secretory system conjugative DNA transfer family protein [Kordia sp.]|uniref:type IV secretory system conjugative DNA transfer family protein n=1 Tax=Kordia sp. TaxID=1965332 RepID=UPI003D6B4858